MVSKSSSPSCAEIVDSCLSVPCARYDEVRQTSLRMCEPLQTEDYVVQSMPDTSPTKWHLAHTSWFFETFVLKPHVPRYRSPDDRYAALFNSYYEAIGPMHPRAQRGLLTRPTVNEVMQYRAAVDECMQELLDRNPHPTISSIVELGLHHEQQHQELMLTDIKHVLSCNPLEPAYRALDRSNSTRDSTAQLSFTKFRGGIELIGAESSKQFCFDNETPRHKTLIDSFSLADRLITNGEYRQFIQDGGYRRADFWLSDGWAWIKQQQITKPLYWSDELASEFTLHGRVSLNDPSPACHISFYEADAFARWANSQWHGARLPTEQEWEVAARTVSVLGNFLEDDRLHPSPATHANGLRQIFGDLWEWTASPYVGYPGYRASRDALGEYNGKFMCNQFVLRGGSCVTPASHIRSTYRNFFPPHAQWQFTGVRLAKDLE